MAPTSPGGFVRAYNVFVFLYTQTEVDVQVNITGSLPVRPGSFYEIPVVGTVPSNSVTKGTFVVRAPLDSSAVLTVHDVQLVSRPTVWNSLRVPWAA